MRIIKYDILAEMYNTIFLFPEEQIHINMLIKKNITTRQYLYKNIKKLIDEGMIIKEKDYISMTKKGEKMTKLYEKMKQLS